MKMKHCPFCGETRIAVGEVMIHKGGNKLPCVWCENCGARVTAPREHPEDAVKRWNDRVSDISRDEIFELNRILRRDIYIRMKEFVAGYNRNENVCTFNDIRKFHLQPMVRACDLAAKFEPLLNAIMMEKEDER